MGKTTKIIMSLITVLCFCLSFLTPAKAGGITFVDGTAVWADILLDSKKINIERPIIKVGNEIYVPLCEFAWQIGAKVDKIDGDSSKLKFYGDSFEILLPKLFARTPDYHGYVFHPSSVSEYFNCNWNPCQNILIIKTLFNKHINNDASPVSQPKIVDSCTTETRIKTNMPQNINSQSNMVDTAGNFVSSTSSDIPLTLKNISGQPIISQIQFEANINTKTSLNNVVNSPVKIQPKINNQNAAAKEPWVITLKYEEVGLSVEPAVKYVEVNSEGYFGVKLDKSLFKNGKPEKLLCSIEEPINDTINDASITIEPIAKIDLTNYKDGDIIMIPASYGSAKYTVTIAENCNEEYHEIAPGIYAGNSYYVLSQYIIYPKNADKFLGLLPTEYVDSNNPEIIKTAQSIVEGLHSDKEKVKALHDFVVNKLTYDHRYYGFNSLPASKALQNGKAVCVGYSALFSALCRAVDIPCLNVGGIVFGSPHEWNMVSVNNEWYFVDTTYDDSGYWNYCLVKKCHGYDVDKVKTTLSR